MRQPQGFFELQTNKCDNLFVFNQFYEGNRNEKIAEARITFIKQKRLKK